MTISQIGDDIIDTRDFDELIEDLAAEVQDFAIDDEDVYNIFLMEEEEMENYGDKQDEIARLVSDLSDLNDFRNELEGYCDWKHGETLIHEDYQQDYAQQLAEDITTVSNDWPHRHIDWKAATEELFAHDYTSAEIEGHTYHVRMS